MTATQARSCGSCIHSVPAVDAQGQINFHQRFCRRYPPSFALVPGRTGMPVPQFLWPTLDATNWCGEWAAGGVEMLLPGEIKPEKADA